MKIIYIEVVNVSRETNREGSSVFFLFFFFGFASFTSKSQLSKC